MVISVLFGAGCVPQKARDSANLLAAYTNQIDADARRYAKFRTELAKARLRNMQIRERDTLELKQETSRYVEGWKIAEEKRRVKLYEGVIQAANEVALQEKAARELLADQERVREETHTLAKVRSDKLQETAKALAELGKEANFREDAQFLGEFFAEVKKSIDRAAAEAEKQSAAGKEAASKAPSTEKKLEPKPVKKSVTKPN